MHPAQRTFYTHCRSPRASSCSRGIRPTDDYLCTFIFSIYTEYEIYQVIQAREVCPELESMVESPVEQKLPLGTNNELVPGVSWMDISVLLGQMLIYSLKGNARFSDSAMSLQPLSVPYIPPDVRRTGANCITAIIRQRRYKYQWYCYEEWQRCGIPWTRTSISASVKCEFH